MIEPDWRQAFDAVPDLAMVLDAEHRIVSANRAVVKRYGDVVGRRCYEVVHGADAPPPGCPHADLLRDGREHIAEVADEESGGTLSISVSPLCDGRGRMVGAVHVARDITAQARTIATARRRARPAGHLAPMSRRRVSRLRHGRRRRLPGGR